LQRRNNSLIAKLVLADACFTSARAGVDAHGGKTGWFALRWFRPKTALSSLQMEA